jgi:hypothetical protein
LALPPRAPATLSALEARMFHAASLLRTVVDPEAADQLGRSHQFDDLLFERPAGSAAAAAAAATPAMSSVSAQTSPRPAFRGEFPAFVHAPPMIVAPKPPSPPPPPPLPPPPPPLLPVPPASAAPFSPSPARSAATATVPVAAPAAFPVAAPGAGAALGAGSEVDDGDRSSDIVDMTPGEWHADAGAGWGGEDMGDEWASPPADDDDGSGSVVDMTGETDDEAPPSPPRIVAAAAKEEDEENEDIVILDSTDDEGGGGGESKAGPGGGGGGSSSSSSGGGSRPALPAAAPPPAPAAPLPTAHVALPPGDTRLSLAQLQTLARVLCPRGPGGALLLPPDYKPDALVGKLGAHTLTRKDAQCLLDGGWLNDDVVNMEMAALGVAAAAAPATARGAGFSARGACGPLGRAFVANSFLVAKLREGGRYDYSRVARWMARAGGGAGVDIRTLDAVLLPVHGGCHWALAAVDMVREEVHYWDSFLSPVFEHQYAEVLRTVKRWVSDETARLSGGAARLDTEGWACFVHPAGDVPQQGNSYDCGVYLLAFARCLVAGAVWDFTPEDIPYLRRALALRCFATLG